MVGSACARVTYELKQKAITAYNSITLHADYTPMHVLVSLRPATYKRGR